MDKDDNTQPMVYPAEGTIMGYGDRYPLDIDGRAVKAQIRYLTYPPAPLLTGIVYSSLRGRMKEPTAKKNGNVGEYYPNHSISFVTGQWNERKPIHSAQKMPEHNLILCRVIWKTPKKAKA